MSLLEEIVMNIIFVMFPILVYFIYCCYDGVRNKSFKRCILVITLFSSLYLCLKYGNGIADNRILLFCNIPVVVAYLKKEPMLGILLSMFTIIYAYYVYDTGVIFTVIKYACYIISYLLFKKERLKEDTFILSTALIQGFLISFEYVFKNDIYDVNTLIQLCMVTLLFYIITFAVLFLIRLVDNITKIHKEIKQVDKEKTIMNTLFKLTHEVKNPIAVCKGYLDMLDMDDHNKIHKYIPIIRQELDRSLDLMEDFMAFSKLNVEHEIVDINLLLDDVYDGMKLLITGNNIKLNYVENEDEVYIMGDYNRLKQVLLNLVKNSKEAIEDQGEIKIEGTVRDKIFVIKISDDGVGMDKDTLKKMKEMFFTTKEHGSGIGVSLSNEIIKAHQGTMSYQSEVGKGTVVTIELPIKA